MLYTNNLELTYPVAFKIASKFFPFSVLENFVPLKGGVFNKSYLLILQNGLKVVLRIAPAQEYLVGYERNLMYAERLAYELCHEYDVPCPNVYFIDDSFQIINRVYMLSEYIPSVSLQNISIPMDILFQCYRDAGKAIRKMHSIKGTRFGRLAIQVENGGFNTWGEALLHEVNIWLKVFTNSKLMPNRVIDAIRNVFENHMIILNKVMLPCLAHGDLWIGNILTDFQNEHYHFRAIIDADHVIFGDPEIDFFSGKMLNNAFAQGYGKDIDDSWDAFIRRRLYTLLFTMRQCYIYKYLHLDFVRSEEQKKYIYHFLNEFHVES